MLILIEIDLFLRNLFPKGQLRATQATQATYFLIGLSGLEWSRRLVRSCDPKAILKKQKATLYRSVLSSVSMSIRSQYSAQNTGKTPAASIDFILFGVTC